MSKFHKYCVDQLKLVYNYCVDKLKLVHTTIVLSVDINQTVWKGIGIAQWRRFVALRYNLVSEK